MALVSTRTRAAGEPETDALSSRQPSPRPGALASHGQGQQGDFRASLGWRARRRWRQVRLGAAFVQFGLTALAVAFVAAPVLRRRARSREESELAVQRVIHRAFRASVRLWQAIGLIRVDAAGAAAELRRHGPCVVVANHPTLIDVVLMGSLLEQMDCIVNAGWTAHSPFLARAIEVAGYLPNDSGRAMVDDCTERLARGRSLLVFPEGTRSPWPRHPGAGDEPVGKYHRGAAYIALASGMPIVAVTIQCRPRFLGSARKWHDVPEGPSCFTLRVARRIDPKDYSNSGEGLPLQARRLTHDLRQIYLQEPDLADA